MCDTETLDREVFLSRRAALMLLTLSVGAVLAAEGFRPLRGPYMVQEADRVPRVFLPGKISSGRDEGCSVFFAGGRSFLWRVQRGERSLLLLLEDKSGRWQPPDEQSLLDGDGRIWDFTLSPDGELLYFTSDALVEGAGRANLWRVRRRSEGWEVPEPLGSEVNTDANGSRDIYWMTADFLDELRSADGGR